MVKISYSKKISIGDLTRLLRELLEVAEKKNQSITVEGIPVPLSFNKNLELELELEIGEDENELEISLEWARHKTVEAGLEIAKAVKGLEESPNVNVEESTIKRVENLIKTQTPISGEKEIIRSELVEIAEKGNLDAEKKLEEVIANLSSETNADIKEEEEIDLKPQGNLLKISEEKPGLETDQKSPTGLQFEIPEYKSVVEPTPRSELEIPELKIEKNEIETEEEDSTKELERILKALKESRLADEDKTEQ